MKDILCFFLLITIYGCSSTGTDNTISNQEEIEYQWVASKGIPTGSFNPFPLAQNPTFSKVTDVTFLSDNELVAMVNFNNEIRVYPYQYISPYESINDVIDNKAIAMTYCPITKSALCWDTTFNEEKFILRASGYLLNDNVVLYDNNSDTYWSQMFVSCVKGKYSGQSNSTFNFIETTWGTIKTYFDQAKVFTNSSISNKTSNKKENSITDDNESVYGVINPKVNSNSEIHIYKYDEFKNETKIYNTRIKADNVIIIGNKENHFITSYINDNSNANFSPIQNSFPIIMEDNYGNKWDVFGVAKEGPRKGEQLKSPVAFVALWWAWNKFYDDFVFNE